MAGSKGGKGGGTTQSVFGPRGGMGGGGIFEQLRQQFPQFMPQQPQPQAQPFAGPQPVLQPQQPGIQPAFAPTGTPFNTGGSQAAPGPPGVQQLGPGAIINDRFGGGQPQQGPQRAPPGAIINESFGLPPSPQPAAGGGAQRFQGPLITESFAPTRAAPEVLMQSPRSPLGPLVDPRGNRKVFA